MPFNFTSLPAEAASGRTPAYNPDTPSPIAPNFRPPLDSDRQTHRRLPAAHNTPRTHRLLLLPPPRHSIRKPLRRRSDLARASDRDPGPGDRAPWTRDSRARTRMRLRPPTGSTNCWPVTAGRAHNHCTACDRHIWKGRWQGEYGGFNKRNKSQLLTTRRHTTNVY